MLLILRRFIVRVLLVVYFNSTRMNLPHRKVPDGGPLHTLLKT
jgi:hypothetical protein